MKMLDKNKNNFKFLIKFTVLLKVTWSNTELLLIAKTLNLFSNKRIVLMAFWRGNQEWGNILKYNLTWTLCTVRLAPIHLMLCRNLLEICQTIVNIRKWIGNPHFFLFLNKLQIILEIILVQDCMETILMNETKIFKINKEKTLEQVKKRANMISMSLINHLIFQLSQILSL